MRSISMTRELRQDLQHEQPLLQRPELIWCIRQCPRLDRILDLEMAIWRDERVLNW